MSGPDAAETVVVGRINGIWGVQGWVKVYSYTEPPDAIFDYQPWLIGPDGTEVSVAQWRQQGPRLMAGLSISSSPEQAARLVDCDIAVPVHALPKPTPGSYYWRDLVGLKVINLEGHDYGKVRGLMATGAHDVLDVVSDSEANILIPFVLEKFIKSVDLDAGQITVDWPLEWVETG